MLNPAKPSITPYEIYSIIENKDNKIEICGHCENGNYIYTHYGNKNSCQINEYYNHIWHTHPRTEKPYPSVEDIMKIIKFRNQGNKIYISDIFTNIGMWRLTCYKEIDITEPRYSKIQTEFTNYLNPCYFQIYKEYDKKTESCYMRNSEGISLNWEQIQGGLGQNNLELLKNNINAVAIKYGLYPNRTNEDFAVFYTK